MLKVKRAILGCKGLDKERGGAIWVQGRGNMEKSIGKEHVPTCAVAN